MLSLVLVDHTGTIAPAELARVAAAIDTQICRDFSPYWNVDATVRAAPESEALGPGDRVVGLFRDPDHAGELGYHDVDARGLPFAKVFPLLVPSQPWSVTASHEALELPADPEGQRVMQTPDGRLVALEVADPVEAETYEIDGILVSDFVLPAWFGIGAGKLDFLDRLTKPLMCTRGGYMQVLDPARGWQQLVTGSRSTYREAVQGRGAKRMQLRG